jgi:hypothetical protein
MPKLLEGDRALAHEVIQGKVSRRAKQKPAGRLNGREARRKVDACEGLLSEFFSNFRCSHDPGKIATD